MMKVIGCFFSMQRIANIRLTSLPTMLLSRCIRSVKYCVFVIIPYKRCTTLKMVIAHIASFNLI